MPGIVTLVALISLHLTNQLVGANRGLTALPLVDASNTTPIVIATQAPHGFTEVAHLVVAGATGNTAANGIWVATPTDTTHLSLTSYDGNANPINSVGNGAYTGGGTATPALVGGRVLLGRQRVFGQDLAPRVCMIPMTSRFGPRSVSTPGSVSPNPTAELRAEWTNPPIATDFKTFEVHVWGVANQATPSIEPDFDATEALYDQVIASIHALTIGRCTFSKGEWIDQKDGQDQYFKFGHEYRFFVEFGTPVPLQITPIPTAGTPIAANPAVFIQLADGSPPQQAFP